MRLVIAAALSGAAIASLCRADLLTVTSASGAVSLCSGCNQSCNPEINVPCTLTCENIGAANEYAYVSIGYTPISIDTTATVDAWTVRSRVTACANATYRIDFTLPVPTALYVNWNIYWPPADNDFLPSPAPESGEWVGIVPAGAHYIEANLSVDQTVPTEATGMLIRAIPCLNADCDGNGVPDWQEIVTGTQHDLNNNGKPDECEPANPYDLDGDGYVANADVGIFLGAWGPCECCQEDFNGDGVVANADLGILLGAWTGLP